MAEVHAILYWFLTIGRRGEHFEFYGPMGSMGPLIFNFLPRWAPLKFVGKTQIHNTSIHMGGCPSGPRPGESICGRNADRPSPKPTDIPNQNYDK